MDSKIIYEKDGMIFTKIDDKKYCLTFSMENKNILIANIIDFSLFKLIYELNGDIYESVNLTKINENEAVAVTSKSAKNEHRTQKDIRVFLLFHTNRGTQTAKQTTICAPRITLNT